MQLNERKRSRFNGLLYQYHIGVEASHVYYWLIIRISTLAADYCVTAARYGELCLTLVACTGCAKVVSLSSGRCLVPLLSEAATTRSSSSEHILEHGYPDLRAAAHLSK